MNPIYSKDTKENYFTTKPTRPHSALFTNASPWSMTTPLSPPLTKNEDLFQQPQQQQQQQEEDLASFKQAWHPLWSNSTWTPGTDDDFGKQQRSKSISTTTTALKDYFYSPLTTIKPGFINEESIWSWPSFRVSNSDDRRHSIAITNLTRPLTPPTETLHPDSCIYKVEFKQHRSGYFYVAKDDRAHLVINLADNVIVEGDRGYDLGKVVDMIENNDNKKEVPPEKDIKRIISRSHSTVEKRAMALKLVDEEKALAVCQAKIKQKQLNMEVFDAEYQWDRRKLTFYFKANERIDFRELVRELFKIYKTRIWMCASPSTN